MRHSEDPRFDLEAAHDDENIEPAVDPDSQERLAEEIPEPPHTASRFDAGTGQGTVTGPDYGEALQERPILDGSTQNDFTESTVPNPHRGQVDPAAVHHQPALNSTSTNRWLIASTIAAVIVSGVLLLLLRFDPLWCGIGIIVALVGLLLVLGVRMSRIGRRARLRIEAVLLAIIWLVPLAIIVSVLVASADEIW